MNFGVGALDTSDKNIRAIAAALKLLFLGKTNNTGTFTCTPNQATTVVTDEKCSTSSKIFYTPRTANASAEVGAGTIYITDANIADGSFTVTHANAATTGRDFNYIIVG